MSATITPITGLSARTQFKGWGHKPIQVPALNDKANANLNKLLAIIDSKQKFNQTVEAYYMGEEHLRRFFNGVVPEEYYTLGLVLGWCGKGVDVLARRCNLEGFDWATGDLTELGVNQLVTDNRLVAEVNQAVVSALIHAVSFAVADVGADDEPSGLIHFHSAKWATGEWNPRTRRLDSFLVISDTDRETGAPTAFTYMINGETVQLEHQHNRWNITQYRQHQFGVPAMPFAYKPRLDNPFGRSRITRSARALQDAGCRALVRLEGHSDIYAFPEFWMLGASLQSAFGGGSGKGVGTPEPLKKRLGRMYGVPDNDDAKNPRVEVKKFDSDSPQPHLMDLAMLARLEAREFGLPDSALSISEMSNPVSAEAYNVSQWELIAEAEGAIADWTASLDYVFRIALAIAHGEETVPEAWQSLTAHWRDPRYTSKAALADAGMKQLSSLEWLKDTDVALELIGLDARQSKLALAQKERAQAKQMAMALAGVTPLESSPVVEPDGQG